MFNHTLKRVCFFLFACFLFTLAYSQENKPNLPFLDEPDAHALYDKMVKTMRELDSISWVSHYKFGAKGEFYSNCTYHIWLKKPNYARVEVTSGDRLTGVLVGDGENFWIYWPNGKPRYQWEHSGDYAREYEKYQYRYYIQKHTPIGMHSLGHDIGSLGGGISMTIFDPSTFHGYTDSMQQYLDGVQSMGTESVDGEECEVIKVSFMKHQRSWYMWISKRDNLPRKLKESVRVSYDIESEEIWEDVKINPEIPMNKFSWTAPTGWKEWHKPSVEEGLLKPGTEAPDFELTSISGGTIKLSDYRGKVVWINKWRCG